MEYSLHYIPGRVVFATIRRRESDTAWNGTTLEPYDPSDPVKWVTYRTEMPEEGGSGVTGQYVLTVPPALLATPGSYELQAYELTGTTALTDNWLTNGEFEVPSTTTTTTSAGGSLVAYQASTFAGSVLGIGTLEGRDRLIFTIKRSYKMPDSLALIQITEGEGLMVLSGRPATDPTAGSLVVDDESAGNITVRLTAASMQSLISGDYLYDIKRVTGPDAVVVARGTFRLLPVITQAVQ